MVHARHRHRHVSPDVLTLNDRIDGFEGAWRALGALVPGSLSPLGRVEKIERIGSSTRIEGSLLPDRDAERLLPTLEIRSIATWDEQHFHVLVEREALCMCGSGRGVLYDQP